MRNKNLLLYFAQWYWNQSLNKINIYTRIYMYTASIDKQKAFLRRDCIYNIEITKL